MSYNDKRLNEDVIPSPSLLVPSSVVLDGTKNNILVDGPALSPGFVADEISIHFGIDEELVSTSTTVGIADAWTMSVWVMRTNTPGAANGSHVFKVSTSSNGTSDNSIMLNLFRWNAEVPVWRIGVYDESSGSQSMDWPDEPTIGVWHNVVATWSGSTLIPYLDGVEVTPFRVSTPPVTQIDVARQVFFSRDAPDSDIRIHSASLWNSVLTAPEILSIYNGGSGSQADLASNFGSYTSAADLQHWWRLGLDIDPDIGKDYGKASTLKPVTSTGEDPIDDADRDADFPTGSGGVELVAVTLPAANLNSGKEITVKDDSGNAANGAITIDTTGGDTVNGTSSETITSAFEARTYVSDGISNWATVGTNLGTAGGGANLLNVTAEGATGTLTGATDIALADSGITLTMPDAVLVGSGKVLTVKDSSGNAGTNPVILDTQLSQEIDGLSTHIMNQDRQSTTLVSDGVNWFVTGTNILNSVAVGATGETGTMTTEEAMLVTSGGVTITLPSASTVGSGVVVYVKDRGGNASGDPITVDTQSAQTIDGLSTILIDTDHESISFLSDGSNWSVL